MDVNFFCLSKTGSPLCDETWESLIIVEHVTMVVGLVMSDGSSSSAPSQRRADAWWIMVAARIGCTTPRSPCCRGLVKAGHHQGTLDAVFAVEGLHCAGCSIFPFSVGLQSVRRWNGGYTVSLYVEIFGQPWIGQVL